MWESDQLHATGETKVRYLLLIGAEEVCITVFVKSGMFTGATASFSINRKQWGRQMVGRQTGKKKKLAGRI